MSNNDPNTPSKKRDPFPDEIESDEEKNHSLKKYKDIAEKLEEIRSLYFAGTLFDAAQKSTELTQYIKDKYPNSGLLQDYANHPRKKIIDKQLKETNRMLDFIKSDNGWELFKDDGQWKVEWQPSDQSPFESFRISGICDVPIINMIALVYEMDLMKTWMPLCKESKEFGQMSLYCKVGCVRIGLFWPIQDRETILRGYGVDDLKNGRILIYFDSKEDKDNKYIKIPPCTKGVCRTDIHLGGYYIERITEYTSKITHVVNTDLKANLPVSVINWFTGTFAGSLMTTMVNAAKFDKDSEYLKRIQNDKEFYGSIRQKLAQNKTMSNMDLKSIDNDNDDIKQNYPDPAPDPVMDIDPNTAIHVKARTSPYVNTTQERFIVADDFVRWTVIYNDYKPFYYCHPSVLNNKLPDPSLDAIKNDKDGKIIFKFNDLDGKIDRTSHIGVYKLSTNHYNLPLNPIGRTGLYGKGLLWRWGPNHAADPIVTRWLRDNDGNVIKDNNTNKGILEFVSIERTDGGGWAIPGGMVDPGENVSRTLKREFGEETMDSHGITDVNEKKKIMKQIDDFFLNNGKEIFKGYCDDWRNTDNSWMETVAVNFHDENGNVVGKWKFKAGDDASKVKWMRIDKNLKLYASHNTFIQKVVKLHNAHW